MNNKHKKLLNLILQNSVKGSIKWSEIESLLIAFGCKVIESRGSGVKFIKNDTHLSIYKPHPNTEALNYRVKLVKDFLLKTGVKDEIQGI
jgi:hypothetical protein